MDRLQFILLFVGIAQGANDEFRNAFGNAIEQIESGRECFCVSKAHVYSFAATAIGGSCLAGKPHKYRSVVCAVRYKPTLICTHACDLFIDGWMAEQRL